jgi:hypothetical protein
VTTHALSLGAGLLALVSLAAPSPGRAQTDYYNTDAGRPITVEDAYAIEHRGVELQAAPLRLERSRGGVYRWGLEPELAVGLLPRTQLEVGVPFTYADLGLGRHVSGLAGVDLSVLHNLNVETRLPAFGDGARALALDGGRRGGPDVPTALAARHR